MTEPVRIGVVGLNYWGPNLARNVDKLAGAELAWCCDLDEKVPAKARRHVPRRAASPPTSTTCSPTTRVDAVIVATSVPTHYALGKRVLEAGKHAFIEKPHGAQRRPTPRTSSRRPPPATVASWSATCSSTTRRCARSRSCSTPASSARSSTSTSNRLNLGKVRPDENALWSLGPHDISVINYLTGEEPEEVSARGECYLQPGVEDVVFGYIRFPSGMTGHLHVSWLDPHKSRKITVVGSDKMVVFDDMDADRKVTVYDKSAVVPEYQSYGEYVTLRFGDIHIPRIANDEPLRLEVQHFVDCVRRRRDSRSRDGRRRPQRRARARGHAALAARGRPAGQDQRAGLGAGREEGDVPLHPSNRGVNLLLGDDVVVGRRRRLRRQRDRLRRHGHRRRLLHPGQRRAGQGAVALAELAPRSAASWRRSCSAPAA